MKKDKRLKKLENELDKIIIAEINSRLSKRKKIAPDTVNETIEEKIREIVRAHQDGKTASVIAPLFSACLQIRDDGKLSLDRRSSTIRQYESNLLKKGRLEVLLAASMNALNDDGAVETFRKKTETFDLKYRQILDIRRLAEEAGEIREKADKHGHVMPGSEATVISYLKDISPMRTGLQKIESAFVEFDSDQYIGEALRKLRNEIHHAWKSLGSLDHAAAGFILGQADAVFKTYRETKPEIANMDAFIGQKETLSRYFQLFESTGDEQRKEQIGSLISTIDATLETLDEKIAKQKEIETRVVEKSDREVDAAYEKFLELKEEFAEGKIDTRTKRNKTAARLRKYGDILKAHGRRVKARDIERFLNSTGLAKPEGLPRNTIYKWAFFAMLPITLGLAILLAYHMLFK